MKIEWPEVIKTGIVPEKATDRELCSDGLLAWANCSLSGLKNEKLPDLFGVGIVAIGRKLGCSATVEDLEKYAKDKGWIK